MVDRSALAACQIKDRRISAVLGRICTVSHFVSDSATTAGLGGTVLGAECCVSNAGPLRCCPPPDRSARRREGAAGDTILCVTI